MNHGMRPNLRSRVRASEQLWDWCILDGCFGEGRIRPSDLDGIVERKDHFLIIEAKPFGRPLETGQRITLEALSRRDRFKVIVVWGPVGLPEEVQECANGEWGPPRKCNLKQFRAGVSRWYQQANGGLWLMEKS